VGFEGVFLKYAFKLGSWATLCRPEVNPRTRLITALALAIAIVIIAVVYFFVVQPQRVQQPLVVVYAYRDTITGIDPSAEDDTGIIVLHAVYDLLVYYDPRAGQYRNGLAEVFEPLNESAWIVKIRGIAKFHDGSPVTAEDVKFSIERSKRLYEEKGIGLGYVWSCVESIDVVDNVTLIITTAKPCDLRRAAAAAYSAFIYSRRILELSRASDPLDDKLIQWFNSGKELGSGPYMIKEYKPESEVILVKFKDWWGWRYVDNPNAPDVVIIKIVEEGGSQEAGLRSGSIDIASFVPRTSIEKLRSEGYGIAVFDTYHNFILMFNTRRWPTNIAEVRRALALLISWDNLVNYCLKGYGYAGSGLIPRGFPGYDQTLRLSQNIEEARRLLREAGVPEGTKLTIVITRDYEEEVWFAQIYKEVLSRVGLDLEIVGLPWEQVKERGQAVWSNPEEAPHMIINDWWPTYLTPYDYLSILECGEEGAPNLWNWAGYCNKTFDERLWEAYELDLRDLNSAIPLYQQLQRELYEGDIPAVNLWDMQHIYVYNSKRVSLRSEAFNPLYTYVVFFQYVEVKR